MEECDANAIARLPAAKMIAAVTRTWRGSHRPAGIVSGGPSSAAASASHTWIDHREARLLCKLPAETAHSEGEDQRSQNAYSQHRVPQQFETGALQQDAVADIDVVAQR